MRRKEALRLVRKHRAGAGLDQLRAFRRAGRCVIAARLDRRLPFPHTERVVLAARETWDAAVRTACGGALGEHRTHLIVRPQRQTIAVVPGMANLRTAQP